MPQTAKRIHVAGKSADDIGNQCGGWTIQWQGESGPVTQGTTVLGAIRQHVKVASKVTYSVDGTGAEGADVAVVVVGETPYAEMNGDRRDLSLAKEDVAGDREREEGGRAGGGRAVLGPAMLIGDALANADAFIAAWLPGTEGSGRRRRALRRLQADRQAPRQLAEVRGPDSDQRRRRQL